jgi:integrase
MSAKSSPSGKKPPKLPLEVKRGNVTVKVYSTINRVNGVVYEQPTLVYYQGDTRVRRRFSNWDKATREAEFVATKLANGENEVLRLKPVDRANYLQAQDILKPFNRPLNLAVAEYAEALALLPVGTTLKEAVVDFRRRHLSVRESKTVSDLVSEFIESKEKAGKSERYLGDLRSRLKRFAAAFQIPVAQVTGQLLQSHLDAMKVGNRSKFNDLRLIVSLLRFATRRKYAPRDLLDELEAVEKPAVRPTETLIFTPDELREMLYSIRPELVPWLVIAAFCGLRSAEILRLDWEEVNLEEHFVEVKAMNAKTAARRLVPLCDAAIAWLLPHVKSKGRLAYFSEENKFYEAILCDVNRARKAVGNKIAFEWKRNAMRHSYCSYRLADTHDAAMTALEAGNSPAMIFRHYRKVVTQAKAQRWFGVMPPQSENIVSLSSSISA